MLKIKSHFVLLLFLIVFLQHIMAKSVDKDSLFFNFIPEQLTLEIGDSAKVKVSLQNSNGEIVKDLFSIYGQHRSISVNPRISDSTGIALVKVKAFKSGSIKLNTRTLTGKGEDPVKGEMPIEIPYPELKTIEFVNPPLTIYQGTSVYIKTIVLDKANIKRKDVKVDLISKEPRVAHFDAHGQLIAKLKGRIKIEANIEGISNSLDIRIIANPVRGMSLSSDKEEIRTGDVISFIAVPLSRSGKPVDEIPIKFSWYGEADYGIGLPANGQITKNGNFVAETPGIYTISASTGGYTASKSIRVIPRNVSSKLELVGHGLVSSVNTSDLWVWPGIGKHSGKDFAVTGTWGANGDAYFWDVSDPTNITPIDTITVDARTVNDVKVSEDGQVCIITREGASNRKNGIVILDVKNPYDVKILSEYNNDLTGGVHNIFIYKNHVFVVNNSRKFDIIDISDPVNPYHVSSFELKTPGHSIHDVWVVDGIAYSSNWSDGIHAIDIGGLPYSERNMPIIQSNPLLQIAGRGSLKTPVSIFNKKDLTGRNHAAFPFLSQSTGNFYVIGGDEWFPFGDSDSDAPNPRGGFHFIDMQNINSPHEVAIYQVPEAGSHNMWVQGDTLFTAYYQGGLRVVDISGELLGDLYKQGREIAFFHGRSSKGFIPNAPLAWGPQPYKGLIYFSDMNSGLYAVRFEDKE